MPVKLAVPKEETVGENRVALVPDVAKRLKAMNIDVSIEKDAGLRTGMPNSVFESQSVTIESDKKTLVQQADIILKVQPPSIEEIQTYKEGTILLGFLAPYSNNERILALKEKKITAFSMELVPRISRAQSIDALSSQAAAAGYKAVLIAAEMSNKFFPMLTTAAGTIRPAHVLVIGAGVAGLQAIATARRLGAIVEAYDVRSATKEQVQSLGAKFIDMQMSADSAGGYARELTEAEKAQQQEILARHVAKADAIITTAAIPGRPSPKIITEAMITAMKPGAVIVDIAAEGGGNTALTRLGEVVNHNGVKIFGPENLPSQLAAHASEMYSKNLLNFLTLLVNKEGAIQLDWSDQILADSVLTHEGQIRHAATRERIEKNA